MVPDGFGGCFAADEHRMISDFVRLESVPVVQTYMSTDVGGDDRFSPGVTDCASLNLRYLGNVCRLLDIVP